jgi:hypothetical protein
MAPGAYPTRREAARVRGFRGFIMASLFQKRAGER